MFNLISLKNGLENVEGFFFDGICSGVKRVKNDLGFIRSDTEFDVVAKFTTNKFPAAPIKHFLRYPPKFKTNFILLNSKNANSMTSDVGICDIDDIFLNLSKKIELKNPIMSSTGVIGYRLDKDKIVQAFDKFDFNAKNSDNVAKSIMTTDTIKKEICFKVELENGDFFNVAAICKGSGMIDPALATMLCFILTDANITREDMQELLDESVDNSFNAISVDGDTSTNDTVMLCASKTRAYDKEAFKVALEHITKELALMLLKDGEGATKIVRFKVTGAKNTNEAKRAAKALSNSLLVKTAIFGEDPNWGRIASTIGASGVECDEKTLVIKYDDVLVYDKDNTQLDEIREKTAGEIMKQKSYTIHCDLGISDGEFDAFGCDLGYDYIKINADYRS